MTDPVESWGADRLDDLVELVGVALPGEAVSADDLDSLRIAPGTEVLGVGSGHGAVVLSCAPSGSAHVQLLVVHPARRRRGLARQLVDAAQRWAAERGASRLVVGAGAPVYLFTGIDSTWTEALCCFEALGYERVGVELDLVCPTRPPHRPVVPPGVSVERVTSDEEVAALVAWSQRTWPGWTAELERAAQAGTVVVARSEGAVVGAAAHSVGRLGVIGPVAVDPLRQGGGVGAAMMAAVLADLSTAGLDRAEIAWVSNVRFYARACGARVGRASVVMARDLAPRPEG